MRRLVSVLLGALLACGAAGIGIEAPARAKPVTAPVDTGTLTVCIGEPNCAIYNGSVGLAPNAGLISNTLTYAYDDTWAFTPRRLTGVVQAIGLSGQTATVTLNVTDLWGVLLLGSVTFTDPGAGVNVHLQVFDFGSFLCALGGCPYRWNITGDSKGFFGRLFRLPGNIYGSVKIV